MKRATIRVEAVGLLATSVCQVTVVVRVVATFWRWGVTESMAARAGGRSAGYTVGDV